MLARDACLRRMRGVLLARCARYAVRTGPVAALESLIGAVDSLALWHACDAAVSSPQVPGSRPKWGIGSTATHPWRTISMVQATTASCTLDLGSRAHWQGAERLDRLGLVGVWARETVRTCSAGRGSDRRRPCSDGAGSGWGGTRSGIRRVDTGPAVDPRLRGSPGRESDRRRRSEGGHCPEGPTPPPLRRVWIGIFFLGSAAFFSGGSTRRARQPGWWGGMARQRHSDFSVACRTASFGDCRAVMRQGRRAASCLGSRTATTLRFR